MIQGECTMLTLNIGCWYDFAEAGLFKNILTPTALLLLSLKLFHICLKKKTRTHTLKPYTSLRCDQTW